MRTKWILQVVMACTPVLAWGQNLVLNPGFEQNTGCPNTIGDLWLVCDNWDNLLGSPDYFSACADDTVSVPYHALGDQWPFEGDAYAGVATFPEKEYLKGELSVPLTPGLTTYLSVRVSPGGFGYPDWTSPSLASSHVGLRLSTVQLAGQFADQFEFNSAILFLPQILQDTAQWTLLAGEFVPDSAYRYVQVGCFFADSLISSVVLETFLNGWETAYALVDNICVSQEPGVCEIATQITPVEPTVRTNGAILFSSEFVMNLSHSEQIQCKEVQILDMSGRVVEIKNCVDAISEGRLRLHLSNLPCGGYIVSITGPSKTLRRVRCMKLD